MASFNVDGVDYPDDRTLRRAFADVRKNVIEWSKGLPGLWDTDFQKRTKHVVWKSDDGHWAVGFYKYGDEYDRNPPDKNPQDMKPTIWHDEEVLAIDPTFMHIYDFFDFALGVDIRTEQEIKDKKPRKTVLRYIGHLLIADAFLIYHKPNKSQNDRFEFLPPQKAISRITEVIPFFIDRKGVQIDTEAYLHYIDAIAQNEDVKYNQNTEQRYYGARGRINNLLTYVNYISSLISLHKTFRTSTRLNPNPYNFTPVKGVFRFNSKG